MKQILILGGGPVGLTLANKLSDTSVVRVVTPNKPIRFETTQDSDFTLQPDSNSGTIFGNSRNWASQHEGLAHDIYTTPAFSDLTGFIFDVTELLKYESELLEQGWPKISTDRVSSKLIFEGFVKSSLWKDRSFKQLPNKLNKHIEFISTPFETIDFTITCNNQIKTITIDDIEYEADTFVFALGGLSNVAFLRILSEKLTYLGQSQLNLLGKGYTNHPKFVFMRIRFRSPQFLSKYRNLRMYRSIMNFDLYQPAVTPRNLRLSFRLWPVFNDSSPVKKLYSQVLGLFGWYTEAQVMAYVELPQLSTNQLEFFSRSELLLEFKIQYNFGKEIILSIENQLARAKALIANNDVILSISEERITIKEALALDSNHHFGGTRMGNTVSDGVVDTNGRCFAVQNLFLVGTSTLPVSSSLHPTLLCAALSLRAADEIIKNA